ncbi:hypothetical protein PUN28_005152 [Cardiocondyla obscurior]|uniref:Uncharacterized protein n=1 Tax=Cardiocondyla obscurior TaxID=286306 RepID=A0AAW2GG41_9HYME
MARILLNLSQYSGPRNPQAYVIDLNFLRFRNSADRFVFEFNRLVSNYCAYNCNIMIPTFFSENENFELAAHRFKFRLFKFIYGSRYKLGDNNVDGARRSSLDIQHLGDLFRNLNLLFKRCDYNIISNILWNLEKANRLVCNLQKYYRCADHSFESGLSPHVFPNSSMSSDVTYVKNKERKEKKSYVEFTSHIVNYVYVSYHYVVPRDLYVAIKNPNRSSGQPFECIFYVIARCDIEGRPAIARKECADASVRVITVNRSGRPKASLVRREKNLITFDRQTGHVTFRDCTQAIV